MALPVFFIIEYSGWLWWYGHSLNEMGAFTVKPFMPTVFGQGKVAQFTTHSYPNIGFGLMMLSSRAAGPGLPDASQAIPKLDAAARAATTERYADTEADEISLLK